ncbi:DNA-directed RNA polymerase III subunit Rpc31-domain-containing protein [Zopfochytrium polystomum]|nr:DNA-directed RNA polymerase III subunit Rpc31-domain-containing protein [Zopfochytrium polystomum]
MSRGRGRGRGRGGFGIEAIENIFYQGTPLFPDRSTPLPAFRPVSDEEKEMLDFNSQFLDSIKESPFYLEAPIVRDDVERYSDRYKSWLRPKTKSLHTVNVDLKYFPEELHQVHDPSRKPGNKSTKGAVDLEKRFKELEKEEQDESKKKKTGEIVVEEEDAAQDEPYDEEEEEEIDDYALEREVDDDDLGIGDDSDGDVVFSSPYVCALVESPSLGASAFWTFGSPPFPLANASTGSPTAALPPYRSSSSVATLWLAIPCFTKMMKWGRTTPMRVLCDV